MTWKNDPKQVKEGVHMRFRISLIEHVIKNGNRFSKYC